MTARLGDMADGLIAVLDERLGPPGSSVREHLVHVAELLHDAEVALARLDAPASPFAVADPAVRASEVSYALMEAARGLMGFAVRLRSRFTGQHTRRAAEPLRLGLRALAAEGVEGDPRELLHAAAHALVLCAPAARIADAMQDARAAGPALDDPIEHLVARGVLPVLQLAVLVQDGHLP